MKDVVLVLVPSLLTLVGVIVTVVVENRSTRNDVANKLTTAQAVMFAALENGAQSVTDKTDNFTLKLKH